jgi:hypothetical protein
MHVIDLDFVSFDDQPVGDLFGQVGVYVLWHRSADRRPTYLGEGDLLARLSKHDDWLSRDVSGVAAITSHGGTVRPRAKKDAEIAEAVLLELADLIDRYPTRNEARGKRNRVHDVFDLHGVLRLNVTGNHPFRHPWQAGSRLRSKSTISLRGTPEGIRIESPWRRSSE